MDSDKQYSVWHGFSLAQKIMWAILIGLYVAMLAALAIAISSFLY